MLRIESTGVLTVITRLWTYDKVVYLKRGGQRI